MIQLQNVNFHYQKKTPLFKELNLDIPTGNIFQSLEILAFWGLIQETDFQLFCQMCFSYLKTYTFPL